MKELKDGYVP